MSGSCLDVSWGDDHMSFIIHQVSQEFFTRWWKSSQQQERASYNCKHFLRLLVSEDC